MVIPCTADFDLLFVLARYEEKDLGYQDRNRPFHEELGFVTEWKEKVINALNKKFGRGEN